MKVYPLEFNCVWKFTIYLIFMVHLTGSSLAHGDSNPEGSHAHGFEHERDLGPHHGLVNPFYNSEGEVSGFLEIKLHADKGDLELWLAKGRKFKRPFDLPLTSTIHVTMIDHSEKIVKMQVRNIKNNEDEDGNATIRENKTNYFVFPGESEIDSKWLMGKDFKASVGRFIFL